MKVRVYWKDITELENSNILPVHKSIYRRSIRRLGIDLEEGVLEGYYGTGIRRFYYGKKSTFSRRILDEPHNACERL